MNPKYPEINVQLVGEDGNAFSIIGRVVRALRGAQVSSQEIASFQDEATSGDYNNLLMTVMKWVNTDNENNNSDEELEIELEDDKWQEGNAEEDWEYEG